jgi:hypothetical protein
VTARQDPTGAAPPRGPWRWAVPLLGALAVLTAVSVLLDVLNAGVADPVTGRAWPSALGGLALGVPGALLLRRLPRHPVAWVMAVGGLAWTVDAAASGWATYAVQTAPGTSGGSAAYYFFQRLGAVLLVPLPLVLLLFPDGRLPRPWWLRVPSLVTLGALATSPLVLALVPSASTTSPCPRPCAASSSTRSAWRCRTTCGPRCSPSASCRR